MAAAVTTVAAQIMAVAVTVVETTTDAVAAAVVMDRDPTAVAVGIPALALEPTIFFGFRRQ